MDLLGTTLETAILPTLNNAIHNKKQFPVPITQLGNTNVLISRFYNRPRDAGASWLICSVDDRRKRVLCAVCPEVAKEFYNKYQTELTEETGLVIKFTHAPALSLISGSFVDSLPPFLPVCYDPSKYRGITDARMIVVVTQQVQKVTQGASLQHRFVPMLSVVIDKQLEEKPIYPPDRRAKRRVEFQEGYLSQKSVFTDLNRLAEPSKGSLDDSPASKITEEFLKIGRMRSGVIFESEAKKKKEPKQFDHTNYVKDLLGEDDVGESIEEEDDNLDYWTEVFHLLKEDTEIQRRTPFLGSKEDN